MASFIKIGTNLLILGLLSGLFAYCKTPVPGSKIQEEEPVAPDPLTASYISKLDANCGNQYCHGNSASILSYSTLSRFANQTRSYHQCLEQKDCFGELDKVKALTCWDCITGAGGLRAQGGLYHSAIWNGIVRKIMETAEIDYRSLSLSMMRMPPSEPIGNRNIAGNILEFKEMAAWFTQESNTDFPKIRVFRPPSSNESEGSQQLVTCDSFSPIVERQIIADFSMDGISMFGCKGTEWPEDPKTCHSQIENSEFADVSTPGIAVKILRKLEGRPKSSYWMRSSPDGRYSSIGNGYIEDLKISDRRLHVNGGSIDPAFSPDNKFYVWPSMLCPIAPLAETGLSEIGTSIAASGCISQSIGVYASLGTDSNGDILLISGYTNNNFGGRGQTRDASDMPGKDGSFTLRRISNNRIIENTQTFETPFETDYQISPSGRLVVGRLVSTEHGQVFRLRTVRPDGSTIDPSNNSATGIICMKGEKANISFDNRYIVFHHYADGSPQDKGQSDGTANIFVYDILKKRGIRVTNFQKLSAGAYFPHFRADGWMTFLIKSSDGTEMVATSNAALILGEMP